ncbi:MAG: DUF4266 domain-containing protein [Parafilimonas sp.]
MKQRKFLSLCSLLFVAIAITTINTSCTSVKPYQKNKLNDAEMSLSGRKVEKTELNFQTYREGASGANGGKTGGGCGCN